MKNIIYLISTLLFISCGKGYELKEIYVQKIENSTKSIYDYQAWSTLNDGAKYGQTILDTNESIGIQEAEQMSFELFSEPPTKDTLFLLALKDGGNRIPKYLSTDYSINKGFVVKTDYYTYAVGSSANLTYKFLNFRETDDSLIFLGVEIDYFNLPSSKNEIGFRKGNIKLVESDSLKGFIKQIEVTAFLLKKYTKSVIDKQIVIGDDSLSINGLVHFKFEPNRLIKTSEFSNYGLYKKREFSDVRLIK